MSKETREQVIAQLNDAIRQSQVETDAFDQFVADSLGINRTDLRCMDILERTGPMTAGDLAKAAHLTSGAVTAVLDRMEEAGIVTRVRDTEDRRRVRVEMTPEARAQGNRFYEGLARGAQELYGHFTTAQLRLVLGFLQRGREMASRAMGELKARPPEPGGAERPSRTGRPPRG
jgi:DNA-binding MarR family transcriptional regulator